jgi:peptide/nickel transport system permease protein
VPWRLRRAPDVIMRRGLAIYVLRRLLSLAILLVFISFGVFSLLYVASGDPVDILLGVQPRTEETVTALREEYHLNEPFLTQYWIWAQDAARFEFGNSIQTTLPVTDEIRSRLPVSVFLGVYAFILTMVFGVALGIRAAIDKHRAADRGIVAGSVIGLSTPAFVSGVFLLYVFGVELHWFPIFGPGEGFVDRLWHLTLPAIALALVACAYIVKHTRAALLNVLDQDYVTFARARGLSKRRVLFLYGLRNGLIPIVTLSGPLLAFLITGAVLVEVTFSLPGIGQLLVQSATTKDLPLLQGITLVAAIFILVANLLVDLMYMAVDPRIRLGSGT